MNRLYTAIVAGLLLTVCGCRGNEYEEALASLKIC